MKLNKESVLKEMDIAIEKVNFSALSQDNRSLCYLKAIAYGIRYLVENTEEK